MKLFYYIKRFWEIPGVERKIILIGIILSGIFRLLTWVLPIKFCLSLINLKPRIALQEFNDSFFLKSRVTLRRILRLSPWTKNCFVKALTYKYLLNRYGMSSDLVFSIRKDGNNRLIAHAYLSLENNLSCFKRNSYFDVYRLSSFKCFSYQ